MSKTSEKYVHEGFSELRGPVDEKAKSFVLASCEDTPETLQKLRQED